MPKTKRFRAGCAATRREPFQVGSAETLLDDAVRLAAVAGSADVRVTLEVWPDMIHASHLFYPQLAAGRLTLAQVGAFLRSHFA